MRTSRSFLAWTLVPPALRWFLSVAVLALPLQLAAQDKHGPSAFTGRWELTSDDGTDQEVVELSASGNEVSGTLTVLSTVISRAGPPSRLD